jgi:hypothetical protein
MEFNSALDIIIKDLGEAAKIIDDLKNYSGVPAFQVELAKAKCRSAAELIALLKEIPMAPEARKESEVRKDVPLISEPVKASEPEKPKEVSEPAKSIEKSEPEKRKEISEPSESENRQPAVGSDTLDLISEAEGEPATIEEAPVPRKKETGKQVVEKPASVKGNGTGAAIFADRFKDVPGRVSEKVQPLQPEKDLTSRMKQSPISNLADAIGVNDRFYFIREVFGGNNNNYREAIDRLNSVSKVNEAIEIINGYTVGETNQEAIKDLLALVKRKTGYNE